MIGFTAPSGNSYKGYTLPNILLVTYLSGDGSSASSSYASLPLIGIKHIYFNYSKGNYGDMSIVLYDKNNVATTLVSHGIYVTSGTINLDVTHDHITFNISPHGADIGTLVISSISMTA